MINLDWNCCPKCGDQLDTGYECDDCKSDWLPAIKILSTAQKSWWRRFIERIADSGPWGEGK